MKKFLSILLVLLMLAIPLASCSDNPDDNKDSGNSGNSGNDVSGAEVDDVLEIPEGADYEEYEFVILNHTNCVYNYAIIDFDEPSDDAYENALYERNTAVEELLNVTISEEDGGWASDVYSLFKTSVDANTDDYDICFNAINYCCTATGAGLCYDLDSFEYIDLDKSWWNADCTEQLALGNMHYMACGDISLSDKECLWAVYFIKRLVTERGLENPYDLVKNNQWTWDKMHQMASTVAYDDNGNSEMDSADTWGLCTHSENFPAMWESAGLKLVTLDSEGIPQLSWDSEEFVNVFEDIVDVMGDSECVVWTSQSDISDAVGFITTSIKNGKTLFGTEVIAFVLSYRANSEENDFGILPFPKYSSDIENYNSYVAVNSFVMVIGNNCSELERTGVITEALAAKGAELLTPVYFDGQLSSKYSRDEESGEMLDIIFEHRCYDLGVFFDWGSAYSSLKSTTVNPAVLYNSVYKKSNKEIEKAFEKLGLY